MEGDDGGAGERCCGLWGWVSPRDPTHSIPWGPRSWHPHERATIPTVPAVLTATWHWRRAEAVWARGSFGKTAECCLSCHERARAA